jgi:gluconokinase
MSSYALNKTVSLLCFDVSSDGISAALLDSELEPVRSLETTWEPESTLDLETISAQFKKLMCGLARAAATEPVVAISIGTFLHNFVLLDAAGSPLTPVFTWLDSRGEEGVEYIRSAIGEAFHLRTGCRYHPMFPVFKLAALHVNKDKLLTKAARLVSLKSFLVHRLTGVWVEDHGTASATGLYNVIDGRWDSELLQTIGLSRDQLPPIRNRTDVIGLVTPEAAREFGVPDNTAVVNGTGDGFLANLGSDCEVPARISVTLGTSAVARQSLSNAVLDSSSGTFCYMAAEGVYLLGCAGNNGGNVLDWGRSIFGDLREARMSLDLPIFIPLLHGERSPDWNPNLTGSWHGLTARHTAADLSRSILEGVVFNLAHFVEIVQSTSGTKASDIILSGNGFLEPLAAPILTTVVDASIWMPLNPGLASLRGSGMCALRALGAPDPPLKLNRVSPIADSRIPERYRQYRSLRYRL